MISNFLVVGVSTCEVVFCESSVLVVSTNAILVVGSKLVVVINGVEEATILINFLNSLS